MRAAAAVCRLPAAVAASRGTCRQAATVCSAAAQQGSGGGGGGSDNRQRTALVVGSSRGLGLEFVSQLVQRPDTAHVLATCREPSAELLELQRRAAGRLTVLPQVDTTDERSLAAAAERIAGGGHTHLDLLINATGILHNPATGLAPETALARVTLAGLLENFQTNAAGHILALKHLAPLLAAAARANGATAERPAVAASLSARVGSISDNRLGGWHSYRASKAALNQLFKCAALEFERKRQPVAAVLLHPGTCDTELSKPFQRNVPPEKLFSRERAVRQLLAVIDGASMADSGRFYDWEGKEVEW